MVMNILLTLSALILTLEAWSQEVKLTVEPREPLVNETFHLNFKINSQEEGEPYISFDPGGLEVLGKSNQGVSIDTTIINGRLTTKREVIVSYELLSERSGTRYVRDINVEINGRKIRLPNKKITIVNQRKAPKDIELVAEVSKSKVYLGEGIDLVYYLYHRDAVVGQEVNRYPKLNKFIKRFHNVTSRKERVNYRGMVYTRMPIYAARLYPEKLGKLTIDPLKLNIQFADRQKVSPFSPFGFQLQRYKTKKISSSPIQVEVSPLPATNVPPHFTGLIGKHEFKLDINKNKFLVNEAVEFNLIVEGPGALENLEAPKIYQDPSLEAFDTRSEISLMSEQRAKKNFEYTLLARKAATIKERDMDLSYFDPETGQYETIRLKVPPLIIGGAAIAAKSNSNTENESSSTGESEERSQSTAGETKEKYNAPEFTSIKSLLLGNALERVIWTLRIIVFFLLALIIKQKYFQRSDDEELNDVIKGIKKDGISYSNMFKVVSHLSPNVGQDSLEASIEQLKISKDAKKYFKEMAQLTAKDTFKNGRERSIKGKFKSKYFNELKNSKPKNESSKRFS